LSSSGLQRMLLVQPIGRLSDSPRQPSLPTSAQLAPLWSQICSSCSRPTCPNHAARLADANWGLSVFISSFSIQRYVTSIPSPSETEGSHPRILNRRELSLLRPRTPCGF